VSAGVQEVIAYLRTIFTDVGYCKEEILYLGRIEKSKLDAFFN